MPLREVRPLNAEQWNLVTNALKNGPSDKQKRIVSEAIKRAKKLHEIKN